MKLLKLTLLLVLTTHCQVAKKTMIDRNLHKAIEAHFEGAVNTTPNSTGSFVVVTQAKEPSMEVPVNALKFAIYDAQKQKIVYVEQKYNAQVSWYNNETLFVKSRPGVKSNDAETDRAMREYYINVKTLEKVTLPPR
ncbi:MULTISPECIES: hypothetical protein [unclassified Carboxylicivirga]|uniref:hypothetical protein n=1 Tax=Carboxylicivirga TaxID=1628153 RepID=UPI003D333404